MISFAPAVASFAVLGIATSPPEHAVPGLSKPPVLVAVEKLHEFDLWSGGRVSCSVRPDEGGRIVAFRKGRGGPAALVHLAQSGRDWANPHVMHSSFLKASVTARRRNLLIEKVMGSIPDGRLGVDACRLSASFAPVGGGTFEIDYPPFSSSTWVLFNFSKTGAITYIHPGE